MGFRNLLPASHSPSSCLQESVAFSGKLLALKSDCPSRQPQHCCDVSGVRSYLEGTKREGEGQFRWLGSASYLSTAVSAPPNVQTAPISSSVGRLQHAPGARFHPAQHSSTSLFWLLLLFLHGSSSNTLQTRKSPNIKKKKKKRSCLELSPFLPLPGLSPRQTSPPSRA